MRTKKKTYFRLIIDKFMKRRLSQLGLALVILMMFVAIAAPFLASDKPYYYMDGDKLTFPILSEIHALRSVKEWRYPEYDNVEFRKLALDSNQTLLMPPIPFSPTEYDLDAMLTPPGREHVMGTDVQGRDIASRMIHGTKVSLSVGFIAVGIYVFLGLIIGSIAGFFGGWVDLAISRVIEIVMCFPTFFLILTVLALVGPNENLLIVLLKRMTDSDFLIEWAEWLVSFAEPSLFNMMLVIGVTGWTGIARLVRGEFLKLKNQDFVQSAHVLGYRTLRIIFRHILPNAVSPVLVSVTFGIASAILVESSLSFLGFGVHPPTPSWGDILSQSREFMDIAWWLMFYPGVAIFLTVTALNLVGEGLRDAIDPRV